MTVKVEDIHERRFFMVLSKEELIGVLLEKAASKMNIPLATLRTHARIDIEKNMEGSPEYQNGYKVIIHGTFPINIP